MQTTLLGFAIGVILALLAALVGPHFVDWNAYRDRFEAEATRLVGLPVRVGGTIDVKLLPTPSLRLTDAEIGRPGEDALRARNLGIEFSLGALVRGQLRATQMHVVSPRLTVAIDAQGRALLPTGALGFNPDALSVEQMNVEDARLVIAHAGSGRRLVFERLWFNGQIRSLAGSFRGEGAFVVDGDLYGYRLSASRQDNGAIKMRFNVDPSERALNAEGEGLLSFDGGLPRYEGGLTLIRPVGTVLASGRAVVNEPWRVSARVKADPISALFEQVEFQYGPDERALKLTGTAALRSAGGWKLDGVLSATQLDIDRLTLVPGEARKPPLAALRAFSDKFAGWLRPPFDAHIGLSVDVITLGGAALQGVKGDIKTGDDFWILEGFELRAPGFTQVSLSGRVQPGADGYSFTGPADIASTDPRPLVAWLEGREAGAIEGPAQPMRLRGDIALGSRSVAIERLRAEVDRKTVEGRLAYAWPDGSRKARLDAELNAAEFDFDGMLAFAQGALGSTAFDRPGEISLALDVGQARIAGIAAQKTAATLRLDATGLTVERLRVGDFGGVSLDGNGKIDLTANSPRGSMTLALDARDMTGIAALIERFAPSDLQPVRGVVDRLGATRLRAHLEVGAAAEPGRMQSHLSLDGTAGGARIALRADATGEAADLAQSHLRLDASIASGDGAVLWRLLGVERGGGATGDGSIQILAEGPFGGAMRVEGAIDTDRLAARAKGTLSLWAGERASGGFDLSVARADLPRLLRPGVFATASASPASFTARAAVQGRTIELAGLEGMVAGARVQGGLALELGAPLRVNGEIRSDTLDAPALVALLTGLPPARAQSQPEPWSREPFAAAFPPVTGQVSVRAAAATLTSALVARDLRATIRMTPATLGIENVEATLAGGKLAGEVTLQRTAEGVGVKARVGLQGADSAVAIAAEDQPVQGRIGLQLELEGSGISPQAVIGSLAGGGTLSLDRARLAGFDPGVFSALIRAADRGLPLEPARVREFVSAAFDAGRLDVAHADGVVAVTGGQARLSSMIARSEGADLAVSGSLDLVTRALDARIVLAGADGAHAAGRPEIAVLLKGDALAPRRSLDVAAVTGWLALRAVEEQAKKLEAIERGRALRPDAAPALLPAPLQQPAMPQPQGGIALPRPRPSELPPASGVERALPLPPPVEIAPAPGAPKPSGALQRPQAVPAPAGERTF